MVRRGAPEQVTLHVSDNRFKVGAFARHRPLQRVARCDRGGVSGALSPPSDLAGTTSLGSFVLSHGAPTFVS
jgi:hypothetical protein